MFICDNDLDGISSCVLSKYYLHNRCSFIYYYITSDRNFKDLNWGVVKNSDIIFFVDTSPKLELYKKLKEFVRDIYIFDHHGSSLSYLGKQDNYIFDDSICGAKIFYNWINEGKRRNPVIEKYITYVNTYDMWDQKSEFWNWGKALHNILWAFHNWYVSDDVKGIIKNRKFIETQINKFDSGSDDFYFTDYELKKAESSSRQEELTYEAAKETIDIRTDNSGNKYIYVELRTKISFIASRILEENEVDYIAVFCTYEAKNMKFSLRSKDVFDVSVIAEKWSGGGHKNSAAFEFKDKNDFENFRRGRIHLI